MSATAKTFPLAESVTKPLDGMGLKPFSYKQLEERRHIHKEWEHCVVANLVRRSSILEKEPTQRVQQAVVFIETIVLSVHT